MEFIVIYEELAWIKLFLVLVLSEDDIYQVIKQFLSWLVDLTIELHCCVLMLNNSVEKILILFMLMVDKRMLSLLLELTRFTLIF